MRRRLEADEREFQARWEWLDALRKRIEQIEPLSAELGDAQEPDLEAQYQAERARDERLARARLVEEYGERFVFQVERKVDEMYYRLYLRPNLPGPTVACRARPRGVGRRRREHSSHAPPGSSDSEGEPEPAGRQAARHSRGALA